VGVPFLGLLGGKLLQAGFAVLWDWWEEGQVKRISACWKESGRFGALHCESGDGERAGQYTKVREFVNLG